MVLLRRRCSAGRRIRIGSRLRESVGEQAMSCEEARRFVFGVPRPPVVDGAGKEQIDANMALSLGLRLA